MARPLSNALILIEAPVFGGLGSTALPSKNVFADTTILSEKEASNAILYPATSALLRRGSARALDVRVRARSGRERFGVEEHRFGARAVSGAHRALPRGPGGGGRVHVHLVLAGGPVRARGHRVRARARALHAGDPRWQSEERSHRRAQDRGAAARRDAAASVRVSPGDARNARS